MEKIFDLQLVADRYNAHWPNRPPLCYSHNWLYGVFMIGNDYRNYTDFYGAYPHGLLDRYYVMFEESVFSYFGKLRILHLFSGSLPRDDRYIRFDLKQEADVEGNAEFLSNYFKQGVFDLIYADPPYSKKHAKRYGTEMPNRFKVIKECYKVLRTGGLLVWLDTTFPMYRKSEMQLCGTIGLIRSTNHRVRNIFVWEKGGD